VQHDAWGPDDTVLPDDAELPGDAGNPDTGIPGTGDPRVDGALAGLRGLAGRPVAEHPAVFEQVHQRLREVLDELDGGPPGAAAGRVG
jgi:hypothetical protein